MTIWTMDQVRGVRAMWVDGVVDRVSVITDGIEPFVALLAARLVHEVRVHDVKAHPGDMEVFEVDLEMTFQTSVTVRWAPSTHTVELRGGPYDGQIVEWMDVPRPLLMPVPRSPTLVSDITAPSIDGYVEYEIEGWQEQERRWVFGAKP